MKKHFSLLLLGAFLSLATAGCKQLPTATTVFTTVTPPSTAIPAIPTMVKPTATAVRLTPTPAPPTSTPTPLATKTVIVASTADSGPGTLRQALMDAQPGDTITFDPHTFPPDAPATIFLTTNLPTLSQGHLTIDASNSGVVLDGSSILADWSAGMEIDSSGNIIRGLRFEHFRGAGIVLFGGAEHNTLGGDRNVGDGPLGQGNLVANSGTGIGIWGSDTSFNTITGNLLGADPAGTGRFGNEGFGIYVSEGAHHNTLGPDNVIAFNRNGGIYIGDPATLGNRILHNSIHDNGGGGIGLRGARTWSSLRPLSPASI